MWEVRRRRLGHAAERVVQFMIKAVKLVVGLPAFGFGARNRHARHPPLRAPEIVVAAGLRAGGHGRAIADPSAGVCGAGDNIAPSTSA